MRTHSPYDLRDRNSSSERFYETLHDMVDRVESAAHHDLGRVLSDYVTWSGISVSQAVCDWLISGVLWNEYGRAARETSRIETVLMESLYTLRDRMACGKAVVDAIRGFIAGAVMLPRILRGRERVLDLTVPGLDRLRRFLSACGEWRQEALRVDMVHRFLSTSGTLRSYSSEDAVCRTVQNFASFLLTAGTADTTGSSGFFTYLNTEDDTSRTKRLRRHHYREDVLLHNRRPAEYLLNLVASELINRSLRPAFTVATRRVVVVPECMRKHRNRCKAVSGELELRCVECDRDCNVARLCDQGRRERFIVRIVKHSSAAASWIRAHVRDRNTAVIGVACPLHLLSGGFKLVHASVPAQCVFLDYCGCRQHWHPVGIPTALNPVEIRRRVTG